MYIHTGAWWTAFDPTVTLEQMEAVAASMLDLYERDEMPHMLQPWLLEQRPPVLPQPQTALSSTAETQAAVDAGKSA